MPPRKKAVSKPIGVVTHYYGGIGVAIVKFNKAFTLGETLQFFGATTDFKEKVRSMEYDHKSIQRAAKGKEVGMKISERVREGDQVFLVEA